jgi:hypothetical protein
VYSPLLVKAIFENVPKLLIFVTIFPESAATATGIALLVFVPSPPVAISVIIFLKYL